MKPRPTTKDPAKCDVIVLGGGPSGLAVAESLSGKGIRVTLMEKDAQVGGLASSFRHNGTWLPKTYHHIMAIDTVSHAFLKKFGLWESMVWKRSAVVFWFHGKPYPLTQPWHILNFRPLSWSERLRLMKLGAICYLKKDWHTLDGVQCDRWLDAIVGKRARQKIFEPLAEMKFGTPLQTVGTGWLGSRLHESSRNRDRYGYPASGLKALMDNIALSIEANGGRILTGMEAIRIGRDAVLAADTEGRTHEFHAPVIVSSLPPEIVLGIHEEPHRLDPELSAIGYKPLICMALASKHLISPYYWNAFMEPALHFGGIFHHTALNPGGGTPGEYLYYLFSYVDENSPLYRFPDERIAETYLKDIRSISPGFDYLWWRIFKIRYSTPIYSIGYRNPPLQSRFPGLYFTGVYRKYPATRTMHTAFQSGLETASRVLERYRAAVH
jgi:protoporphyrinogen oxidase